MSRKVLVTGGAGFIGSHLVDRLLADGCSVRVLDDLSTGRRDNLDGRAEFVLGSITDATALRQATDGVAEIYHLAAIASVERCTEAWEATHRVNQSATVSVLDRARALGGVPVVYASSAAVYGDTGTAVASEDLAPDPLSAYGVDKLGSELHARVASRIHGVPTLGLRLFNIYGPRHDPRSPYSGVISIFARNLAEGQPFVLHGDGGQTRDFVHVSDAIAHMRRGMDRLRGDRTLAGSVLNVCTGRATSIRELAEVFGRVRGMAPRIVQAAARPGDVRHSRGSPERAIATLAIRAGVKLEEGLASVA